MNHREWAVRYYLFTLYFEKKKKFVTVVLNGNKTVSEYGCCNG